MGAYQGVYNLGTATATMLGPALLTLFVLPHGLLGWCALALLFATAAMAMPPTARWAERNNARPTPSTSPTAGTAQSP
ncbi:hypothetical protein [Streptomyces xanthochromogenes]|uniref:hypothetical protein n=1 Tax=Streptomyces xanthochromogenes TaxID=67384 RepID=UPI003437DAC2